MLSQLWDFSNIKKITPKYASKEFCDSIIVLFLPDERFREVTVFSFASLNFPLMKFVLDVKKAICVQSTATETVVVVCMTIVRGLRGLKGPYDGSKKKSKKVIYLSIMSI